MVAQICHVDISPIVNHLVIHILSTSKDEKPYEDTRKLDLSCLELCVQNKRKSKRSHGIKIQSHTWNFWPCRLVLLLYSILGASCSLNLEIHKTELSDHGANFNPVPVLFTARTAKSSNITLECKFYERDPG